MDSIVAKKYQSYPAHVSGKMLALRKLIIGLALKDSEIDYIGESLKWGQPSFLTRTSGSTLRIDWSEKNPDELSLFVNCNTKLISIFKELYPDDFVYIGNRELRMPLSSHYSKSKLKNCISLVLKYHVIKDEF